MSMPQDFQASSEMTRVRSQAAAANDGLDPTSLAGQQAAMARGESVQLVGEEGLSGVRFGVSTTANESAMLPDEGGTDTMTMPQDREAIAAEVQQQHADDMAAVEQDAQDSTPAPAQPAAPASKSTSTASAKK